MGALTKTVLVIAALAASVGQGRAEVQEVGKVVALRGTTTIERAGEKIAAQVKSGIQKEDTFRTAGSSKAKLLFVDDSVLTLGENSTLSIREFIEGKGEKGQSVFNLLDGKLRSVVGRNTFEVITPTAVAAARGTIIFFEVGMLTYQGENRPFTTIACLRGHVEVRSLSSEGKVLLVPGTTVTVIAREPLPPPTRTPPGAERARQAASARDHSSDREDQESAGPGDTTGAPDEANDFVPGTAAENLGTLPPPPLPAPGQIGGLHVQSMGGTAPILLPALPPIEQQPIKQPTRVDIKITVPGPSP